MDNFSFLNTAHATFFADLYDQYLQDPDSLEPSWKAFFKDMILQTVIFTKELVEGVSPQVPEKVLKEFRVINLINGYRTRGHLFTKTNPVRERRTYMPTLELENFDLSDSDLETVFNAGEIIGLGPQPLKVIIAHLEEIYCDSIGVEYMYIRKPSINKWIQNKLNVNNNHPNFSKSQKVKLLTKLIEAVSFENFCIPNSLVKKDFLLRRRIPNSCTRYINRRSGKQWGRGICYGYGTSG